MVAEVIKHFGTVDILVNNARVFRTVPITETTEAMWDEQLDLNLRGAFFCVKTALPEFQKKGSGKVINITSIAGVGAFPNCPAYCASKGGLVFNQGARSRIGQTKYQRQFLGARERGDPAQRAPVRARQRRLH